jgi:hypothetical protein
MKAIDANYSVRVGKNPNGGRKRAKNINVIGI